MQRHFPMLLRGGVPDVGVTVHSHFLTFLATTGQSLGFATVAECPVAWAQDDIKVGDVRADSVWFDRESLAPCIASEFERFERGDETKLRQKVENLAIASNSSPSLRLAVLVYWVRSGAAPRSMESIIVPYRHGFRRLGHEVPPALASLLLVKCVMRPAPDSDRLLFVEFLRDTRHEPLVPGRL